MDLRSTISMPDAEAQTGICQNPRRLGFHRPVDDLAKASATTHFNTFDESSIKYRVAASFGASAFSKPTFSF